MPFPLDLSTVIYGTLAAVVFVLLVFVLPSIRIIGPTEMGLVTKRFSFRKLPDDNPIAFHGEAGYQADLLMPGWHLKLWLDLRSWRSIPGCRSGPARSAWSSPRSARPCPSAPSRPSR